MSIGMWTRVGSRNHVLNGGADPPCEGQFWGGKGRPIVKYRNTLPWAVQKRLNRSRCYFGAERGGARWRNLANTIEPSVCGGDAALGQISLTSCLVFSFPLLTCLIVCFVAFRAVLDSSCEITRRQVAAVVVGQPDSSFCRVLRSLASFVLIDNFFQQLLFIIDSVFNRLSICARPVFIDSTFSIHDAVAMAVQGGP